MKIYIDNNLIVHETQLLLLILTLCHHTWILLPKNWAHHVFFHYSNKIQIPIKINYYCYQFRKIVL